MPRSAPGSVTVRPSSRTSPAVGVSRPATMRSRVDLPQPEGPRIVMKSWCATSRWVGCSASVGWPPFTPGKVRPTPWMDKVLISGSHIAAHRNIARFARLKARSDTSPITPIVMMPKMIWSVASRAWLSVIMWPMPLLAPISSATIT